MQGRVATMSTLDALVEKTYQTLLTVVQTTALSRKVLYRPPFTFLHKLLVETLADYDIFTYQQLEFAELVTKEDKVLLFMMHSSSTNMPVTSSPLLDVRFTGRVLDASDCIRDVLHDDDQQQAHILPAASESRQSARGSRSGGHARVPAAVMRGV